MHLSFLLSMVSSVFLLSAFLSTHTAQLGRTSVYRSLSFVFVETSNSSMILSNLPLLLCSSFIFSWTLYCCRCHWWWEPPKIFICLLCWYLHHLERCLLLHIGRYCSSVCSNWDLSCHCCFNTYYRFNCIILPFNQYSGIICKCYGVIFHVTFPILVT